jgi:hypothetical protein
MKKYFVVLIIIAIITAYSSEVFAAAKGKAPPKKPIVVAPKPTPAVKPAAAPSPIGDRGFAAKGGLMGGAGAVELGYYLPVGPLSCGIYAGYGVGNKYNEMVAQLEGIYKLSAVNIGLSIDYANYSEKVRNIPGLSGDTAKGAHTGIGLSLGKDFGKFDAKLGYSTAFGLIAAAGYKF